MQTCTLHPVTIMSTKKNNGGKPSSGGRKGSGKRKNNKERGNTQKNDNRQQRPRTVARLNIVAPVQWALVFMAQMMAFPLKKGAAMVASTVDDIISLMTTLPMHESDPNLAIDTFRELKEKNQTDAYGRGFTFDAFKSFLSKHPALQRLRLRHDKKLTDALFGKHSSPKVNRAAKAAFDAGHEAYQKRFGEFLKDNNLTPESFMAFSEQVRETFWKTFNPAFTPGANYAVWQFEHTKIGKKDIRKGDFLTKTQFNTAFRSTYKLEGKEEPSKAYRLRGTVKVKPKTTLVVDGTRSYRKASGDPVSIDVDWVVVHMPSKGAGEFYLNRILHFGKEEVNPAYGHLLQDAQVKRQWDNAGLMRLGWRPNPQLAGLYSPELEEVLTDYTLNVGDAVATMSNGGTMQYIDGHWVIEEAVVAEKRPKRTKKPKFGASRNGPDDHEDEGQPVKVG